MTGGERRGPFLRLSSTIRSQTSVHDRIAPRMEHSRSEWSGVFERPSASSLARGFAKTPPAWLAQAQPCVSAFISANRCHQWFQNFRFSVFQLFSISTASGPTHTVFRAADQQITHPREPNHVQALHDVVGAAVHPEIEIRQLP